MKFDFLPESDKAFFIHKASTLVEALPYIRQHAGKNIVIKYGGHAMIDPKLAKNFSKDICLLKQIGINPIIVHGGGPQINEVLKKKKIDSSFINGLRITDKKTIKIVEDVLSNEINTKIVENIKYFGGKAKRLIGNKNNLIYAKKLKIENKNSTSKNKQKIDLGFVGLPTKISVDIIKKIILNKGIPVISPLGIDKEGKTYNINADTAAGAIAVALKASKLLLLTDVSGIMNQKNKLISLLSNSEAKKVVNKKFVVGGMRPKILTCIQSINEGVGQATILDGRIPHSLILELFTEHGIGTQIYSK